MTHRSQRGLTLIELLVALLMGLVIITAIVRMFLYSRDTYDENAALAQIQENGRLATELIAFDLRNAGYRGECLLKPINNHLNLDDISSDTDSPLRWPFDLSNHALGGWNDGAEISVINPTELPFGYTDAVLILHAAIDSAATVTSINSSAVTLSSAGNIDDSEDILLISDDKGCDLFQDTATNSLTLGLTGGTGAPGNADSSNWSHDNYDTSHMSVNIVKSAVYYIKQDAENNNLPTLYRRNFSNGTPGALEPLVEGILDLQITYGLDDDMDLQADRYVSAGLSSLSVDSSGASEWDKVVSVRISLLAVNTTPIYRPNNTNTQNQTQKIAFPAANDYYKTLESAVENEFARYEYDTNQKVTLITLKDPNNGYRIGQVFTTTIAIRNRLL